METLRHIDLRIAQRLRDREFRREWFRAELETNVPDLFRSLRERRGLTQNELAEAAAMKQSAICRFEGSSDAKWKLNTLLTLAEALDARLIIGLEASEDVIERIAKEERQSADHQKSVITEYKHENLNMPRGFAQAQTGISLPGLKPMSKSEWRPWN